MCDQDFQTTTAGVALKTMVLLAIFALCFFYTPSIYAKKAEGGVKVRILRLNGREASRPLAVKVYIGKKELYITPYVKGPNPEWNRSLRVWTAVGNPIVFEVLESGRIREVGARSNDDSIIETMMGELVTDFESEPVGEKETGHKKTTRIRTVCIAQLPWPPTDGEHRVPCDDYTLVVVTRVIRR